MQTDILKDEQTRLLYASLPSALAVNTLLALILAALLRSVVAPNVLFGWLALLGIILLARMVLLVAWRRSGLFISAAHLAPPSPPGSPRNIHRAR